MWEVVNCGGIVICNCSLCDISMTYNMMSFNNSGNLFCPDCRCNLVENRRDGISGRLQIADKKEEIKKEAD